MLIKEVSLTYLVERYFPVTLECPVAALIHYTDFVRFGSGDRSVRFSLISIGFKCTQGITGLHTDFTKIENYHLSTFPKIQAGRLHEGIDINFEILRRGSNSTLLSYSNSDQVKI